MIISFYNRLSLFLTNGYATEIYKITLYPHSWAYLHDLRIREEVFKKWARLRLKHSQAQIWGWPESSSDHPQLKMPWPGRSQKFQPKHSLTPLLFLYDFISLYLFFEKYRYCLHQRSLNQNWNPYWSPTGTVRYRTIPYRYMIRQSTPVKPAYNFFYFFSFS